MIDGTTAYYLKAVTIMWLANTTQWHNSRVAKWHVLSCCKLLFIETLTISATQQRFMNMLQVSYRVFKIDYGQQHVS